MRNPNGFNLIELMVVVAILAIIAAVAVPIYTNNVYRSKQVEAKTLLLTLKVEEEQYRAENNCYVNSVTAANLPQTFALNANSRIYKITTPIPGASGASCTTAGFPNDFQATVTGKLAGSRPDDKWGISNKIPAPVHCDGRSGYTADQTEACPGSATTEIEY
ncbi:MAG: prepilin-type N-terminal cleavage/methylation domain-containing protein [Nitrospirae bacterium]|nr:prepilin-type N-terminal cleavage/methylation domain-containing protein [Nitrospirota bacterium]